MTNVINFPRHRFTPDDVAAFNEIALPKLQRGLWGRLERYTSENKDQILVFFAGVRDAVFMFERDDQGYYKLLYVDQAGHHITGHGWTSQDCLSCWSPPTRKSA